MHDFSLYSDQPFCTHLSLTIKVAHDLKPQNHLPVACLGDLRKMPSTSAPCIVRWSIMVSTGCGGMLPSSWRPKRRLDEDSVLFSTFLQSISCLCVNQKNVYLNWLTMFKAAFERLEPPPLLLVCLSTSRQLTSGQVSSCDSCESDNARPPLDT